MLKKTTLIAAAAVGYVLGARAGRERYEQIVSTFDGVRSNPQVRKATAQAQDFAEHQVVPVVKEKAQEAAGKAASAAGDAASAAKDKAKDLVSSDDVPTGPDTSVPGAPSGTTPKSHGDPLAGTPENPVKADDA